jgi:hypothetical protein
MRACVALTLMLQSSVAGAEEWVVVRKPHDVSAPNILAFSIIVKSYDCDKQSLHEDSTEFHMIGGSVHTVNSSKWPQWLSRAGS